VYVTKSELYEISKDTFKSRQASDYVVRGDIALNDELQMFLFRQLCAHQTHLLRPRKFFADDKTVSTKLKNVIQCHKEGMIERNTSRRSSLTWNGIGAIAILLPASFCNFEKSKKDSNNSCRPSGGSDGGGGGGGGGGGDDDNGGGGGDDGNYGRKYSVRGGGDLMLYVMHSGDLATGY
jgi:hypothetical protein